MTPKSPSPALNKGIDEIVNKSPNKVGYSTLNGKKKIIKTDRIGIKNKIGKIKNIL